MGLRLIHGPPNSGRAGRIRRSFAEAIDRGPVLVVPTVDDVFSFERELCAEGAVLGGEVTTFRGLFRTVLAAGGTHLSAELTPAQRMGAVCAAVASRREGLGPLRRSAERPGFPRALERLLDELQSAGLQPADVEAAAGTLEGSAYLGDVASLFGAYAEERNRVDRVDAHDVARAALEVMRDSPDSWQGRPVLLYGLDDLTRNQLELVRSLAGAAEVTVALPYEPGNSALAARASLLERLAEIGVDAEEGTEPEPGNTDSPLLFHLERGFGAPDPPRRSPDDSLVILRSAGERGEAEAIASAVARLVATGVEPDEIAIVLRDPARRGPLLASVLESYGVAAALEAEMPVAATGVGGALIALLEAELGAGRSADLLRFLRGPSGLRPARVDWFERALRRRRVQDAATALELWEERFGDLPHDVTRLRAAASGSSAELAAEVGRLAITMASRPMRDRGDGPWPEPGEGLELRAAAAISAALGERAELDGLAPAPAELSRSVAELEFRAWSGPVEGRVRIADPYRLRAARFDHVVVGSLQDGEFPRRERGGDPFLSEAQRTSLGLEARRETEAEERYLFHACLALPRKTLVLSYRDSDEDGVAESRSPLLDDVRRLLDPAADERHPDPVEESISVSRDLVRVVSRVAEAASEDELARAIAAHGPGADATALMAAAAPKSEMAERITGRLEAARAAETAGRAPGPLTNSAVLESLGSVRAYGGTTLEGFDLCSYRWFVSHELDPQPLDPVPDPLVQGGLMHEALYRLYGERPGGDSLPRPGSLAAWRRRGTELVVELAAERGLGDHPAERALLRRVEALLLRFVAEEAARETGGFEPWLLEAGFGEEGDSERSALEIDGWALHGAIDRVDRDSRDRALVLDYKLAGKVTPREKLEEEAKLQLQLYMIAVAELWEAQPVGGLYQPLRATSARRPRGAVLDEVAEDLNAYRLSRTDLANDEDFAVLLADARERATAIVARMRQGDIRRDPGPRPGLRGHGVCPRFCAFAPICRRDRAPTEPAEEEEER